MSEPVCGGMGSVAVAEDPCETDEWQALSQLADTMTMEVEGLSSTRGFVEPAEFGADDDDDDDDEEEEGDCGVDDDENEDDDEDDDLDDFDDEDEGEDDDGDGDLDEEFDECEDGDDDDDEDEDDMELSA